MTANFMLVSDDKYTKNLGICTYSVLHNMCPAVEHVRIFVMDCGITEENKAKLRRQAARFDNAELVFHNIEQQLDEVSTKPIGTRQFTADSSFPNCSQSTTIWRG